MPMLPIEIQRSGQKVLPPKKQPQAIIRLFGCCLQLFFCLTWACLQKLPRSRQTKAVVSVFFRHPLIIQSSLILPGI